MKIFYGSENFEKMKTAVALGDFDAIHKGHIKIISSAGKYAKEHNCVWTVHMFSRRPNKTVKTINDREKRLKILEELGVEAVVVENFTDEIKNTSCEKFITEYIAKRLNAKAVFVGENYHFGMSAAGDAKVLEKLCREQGIKTFISKYEKTDGIPVSSTRIREMIENGDVEKARELMTRSFSLSGEVVKGKQIGRTIGFPTANVEYPRDTVIPQQGVYITMCRIGNEKFSSVTNVGEKPTVSETGENIETAINGFSGDIYGEKIEIEFIRKIRDIKKFDKLSDLSEQLENDMNKAKAYFEKGKKSD